MVTLPLEKDGLKPWREKMIIWVTGMSASGKTTLCEKFLLEYRKKNSSIFFLDGDAVRNLYGDDLGFSQPDRVEQINRMQNLAVFCERQVDLVLVAALYNDPEILERNRVLFQDYLEVYIKADLKRLQKREFKGLYSGALRGEVENVVGVDIPWIEPENPDLVFDISQADLELDFMVKEITRKLATKRRVT